MRRLIVPLFLLCSLAPTLAVAQPMGAGGLTPLALDLRKVPIGSWAEYKVQVGTDATMSMKLRWALVARDAAGSTLETTVEGGAVAAMGGKMIMKVTLVPDPLASDRPIKQAIVQVADRDPMEMPLDQPNMPPQRFQKPDPKKLVGKQKIKVLAGSFKASHYHDVTERGIIDLWISDAVGPLGLVKMTAAPDAAAAKADPQAPTITMELTARGKDARSLITKPARPFDPAELGGHAPTGAPAAPGQAPPPARPPSPRAPGP
jgi:hypothetical protein